MNRNLSRGRARINQLSSKTVMLFEVQGVVAQIDKSDEGRSQGAKSFSATGNGIDGSLVAGNAQVLYSTGWLGRRPAKQKGSQFDDPAGWHSGNSNFLFGDGHVKNLKPGAVSSGLDAAKPTDPQTGAATGNAAGVADNAHAATFSTQ